MTFVRPFVVFMLGVMATQAGAEQIELETHGLRVLIDPPPWSTVANMRQTSEVGTDRFQTENGLPYYVLQAVPKGQSFENWHHLYGVTVEDLPDDDFPGYVRGVERQYIEACTKADLLFWEDFTNKSRLFGVLCGAYKDQQDIGEVGIYRMEMRDHTMVKVFYEIIVPAFDVDEAKTVPPLPEDQLRSAVARVGRTQVWGEWHP